MNISLIIHVNMVNAKVHIRTHISFFFVSDFPNLYKTIENDRYKISNTLWTPGIKRDEQQIK